MVIRGSEEAVAPRASGEPRARLTPEAIAPLTIARRENVLTGVVLISDPSREGFLRDAERQF